MSRRTVGRQVRGDCRRDRDRLDGAHLHPHFRNWARSRPTCTACRAAQRHGRLYLAAGAASAAIWGFGHVVVRLITG